ncbi:transmembrane protein 104-like isoform X4 [Branchiostoma floridae x Branchiostoma belcheri]
MAGDITETGSLYSPFMGLIYIFNLIVGTGALTMPKAFGAAGWLISLVLIILLGFFSFMTTTFVVETMSVANARLRWKTREKQNEVHKATFEEKLHAAFANNHKKRVHGTPYSYYERMKKDDAHTEDVIEDEEENQSEEERRALLAPVNDPKRRRVDLYDITERVEMGQMASMFFNKIGWYLFYLCIVIYLYGDLAIYAAAVPKSLRDITCPVNITCNVKPSKQINLTNSSPCWGTAVNRQNAYRVYLGAFSLLLGPFVFFNVQKTKYLQLLTSLMRWVAFTIMIILAMTRITHGKGEGHPVMESITSVPNLFGVCVYSFMCQHSLPSLVTPIKNKRHLSLLVFFDFLVILIFYLVLSFTGIFCFKNKDIKDIYTLNFMDKCDPITSAKEIGYFLGLFPVFTLSTNFPIIAITLRNNLKTLFHRDGYTYPWIIDRIFFPLLTIVPPIAVAFGTDDLEFLVGVTGSYAGAGIQYLIPAFLVYSARKEQRILFGPGSINKHTSPFRHTFWVYFVLIWGTLSVVFVTVNHILTKS